MLTTALNVQRHTVACSIVVHKPYYKARNTVITGPKYYFSLYFVYLVAYRPNQVAKYMVTTAPMYRDIQWLAALLFTNLITKLETQLYWPKY